MLYALLLNGLGLIMDAISKDNLFEVGPLAVYDCEGMLVQDRNGHKYVIDIGDPIIGLRLLEQVHSKCAEIALSISGKPLTIKVIVVDELIYPYVASNYAPVLWNDILSVFA